MIARPRITRAGPAHPIVLAAIHAQCFAPAEAWDATIMAAELSMPGVFAFLSEPSFDEEGGNEEGGGMILARAIADEAEILTLGVVPAARRQGIARALVDEAALHANALGAVRFFLEVSTSNLAAQALYRRAGFVQVGIRRRYYPDGSDALVLSRSITSAAIARS
jgi:ribosomal-protein-alanine N-acetyltransferase